MKVGGGETVIGVWRRQDGCVASSTEFLKLPVPQRKVAREVILALARANGVLPLGVAN